MPYCSAHAHCEWLCRVRFHDAELFLSIKEEPESQFKGLIVFHSGLRTDDGPYGSYPLGCITRMLISGDRSDVRSLKGLLPKQQPEDVHYFLE